MKNKRLFLHIGTLKTGSTLIQFFCMKNRRKLLDEGVLFPNADITMRPDGGRIRSSGHYSFIPALMNDNLAVFKELEAEIAKHNNVTKVILSSENFSIHPELISKLRMYLGQFKEVKIIVYLRRQDLYLESIYTEFISGGWRKLSKTPIEFFGDCLDGKGPVECNYYNLLEPWAKAFGKTNILVRPFEQKQWVEGDLIKDFLNALNLPWRNNYVPPGNTAKNVSPPAGAVEIIRNLNRIPLLGSFYRAALKNFFDNESLDYYQYEKKFFASPRLRSNVLQHYAESNQRVAHEYLDRSDDLLFYEPAPKEDEPWQPVTINNPDLVTRVFTLFLEQKALEIEEEFSRCNRRIEDNQHVVQETLEKYRKELEDNQRALEKYRKEVEDNQHDIHEKLEKYRKEKERIQYILYHHILAIYQAARKSPWRSLSRFFRSPGLNETKLLSKSGLVDHYYYFKNNAHAIQSGITAAEHYVRYGAQQGKNPSENFNTLQYLAEHPDVARDGLNPLVHFLLNKRT